LDLLIQYAFTKLNLHQLYANIDLENEASLALFTNFGFQNIGVKKQWNLIKGRYKDEALFQLINNLF
jgi:diamine N-acetyltransferase